jgi:flagellar hook-associated protein 1 FlgK
MAGDLLGIGRSALSTSKKSMATTGHNIANANTEGYSRQRVIQKANHPVRDGNVMIGRGVDVSSVTRSHDELVQKKVYQATTDNKYAEERTNQLSQLESIFNEIHGDGMNKLINNFFNSFRELANQPENETLRSIVRDQAHIISDDFRRISEKVNELEDGINRKIDVALQDINALSESIAKLNVGISQLEIEGRETGDLRDQRDVAIEQLSQYFKVKTYSDDKNQFVVSAENVGAIVVGSTHQSFEGKYALGKDSDNRDYPDYHIVIKERPRHNFTYQFRKGILQGLVESRDTDLENLRKQVDSIAFQMIKGVNAIHRRGYIAKQLPLDQNGKPYNDGSVAKITGIDFFQDVDEIKQAALKMRMNDLIKEDPKYIATALNPNSPGDNRVALAITKLQHTKIASEGTATLEEEYLKTVGKVGVSAAKAKMGFEQSKGILAQMKSMRERISGVSIDEEATKMIQYQHAYQAAAKVISASQVMFDALLNMKR